MKKTRLQLVCIRYDLFSEKGRSLYIWDYLIRPHLFISFKCGRYYLTNILSKPIEYAVITEETSYTNHKIEHTS